MQNLNNKTNTDDYTVTRINALLNHVICDNINAILLNSPHNLRYYTNFAGGEGFALISKDLRCLFVDSRYTEEALKESPNFTVIEYKAGTLLNDINKYLKKYDNINLGFEDLSMTVRRYNIFKDNLAAKAFVPLKDRVDFIRMVKTDLEISYLRTAEEIGVSALSATLPFIKEGVRENDIVAELEYQMIKHGAQRAGFETIVVSGEKSAMPHGKPGSKKLKAGDFVTIDFGCLYNGYHSDMTRTFIIGDPTQEQRKIYDTVLKAQLAGLNTICAGKPADECDKVSRDIIENAGYGQYFGHALGHGVGLEIHELPTLSPKSSTVLKKNMIVTCEPGIYISGIGGVRIEDMVAVTESGCEILGSFDKELIIC